MELIRNPRMIARFRLALDLSEAGILIMKQNLYRRHPKRPRLKSPAGLRHGWRSAPTSNPGRPDNPEREPLPGLAPERSAFQTSRRSQRNESVTPAEARRDLVYNWPPDLVSAR